MHHPNYLLGDTKNISNELSTFMFKNKENFFRIIEQMQKTSLNEDYLLDTWILKDLDCLNKAKEFISKLDKEKLSDKENELLSLLK
jgi:hypothetical protein